LWRGAWLGVGPEALLALSSPFMPWAVIRSTRSIRQPERDSSRIVSSDSGDMSRLTNASPCNGVNVIVGFSW